MELNTLGELIRDHEPAGPSRTTVDRLVVGALHRGRRTRTGRRVAAGVAGCALLVSGAAVVGQWPGRTVEMRPIAPTATVSATVATPTTTESADPSATPTPSTSKQPTHGGSKRAPTSLEVAAVLESGLPSDFRVSQVASGDESLEAGVSTSFTVTDRAGRAWVGGGVQADIQDLECDPETCTREGLAGGNLSVLRSPEGEKAGDGTWYYYQRPDDRWVWLGQANAFEGNGPVTRPELPLTERQVRALLTAPEWDALVDRCAAAGQAC